MNIKHDRVDVILCVCLKICFILYDYRACLPSTVRCSTPALFSNIKYLKSSLNSIPAQTGASLNFLIEQKHFSLFIYQAKNPGTFLERVSLPLHAGQPFDCDLKMFIRRCIKND